MQLVDFSINEGPVAVSWLLDSREDELDLEIHGCGCGCTDGGCGCGCGCTSCSSCSCSSDDEDDMSADDYEDLVVENGLSVGELDNVEQCKDDLADGATKGSIAGTIAGVVKEAVMALFATNPVTVPAAVTTVVATTAGGSASGAAMAAMNSEACAAAPQELAEASSSIDPSYLERKMEEMSLSTVPKALEGR